MKIYWTISSIPELGALPKKERGRIWRECYAKSLGEKKVWLALLACGLCAGLVSILGGLFEHSIIGAGVGGGIGGFFYGQVATRAALPYIRAATSRTNEEA